VLVEDNPVLTRLHLNVYPVNTRIHVLMIRCYHWSFHQRNVQRGYPVLVWDDPVLPQFYSPVVGLLIPSLLAHLVLLETRGSTH
jgi:hypothetical protein